MCLISRRCCIISPRLQRSTERVLRLTPLAGCHYTRFQPVVTLVLLSDMALQAVFSTENCTATRVCAWQVAMHLQRALPQFFLSVQSFTAVFDLAVDLHG